MFNNKIFKTSLLISISVHFLVFLLISPEIKVGSFSYASFPQINCVNVSLSKIFLKENLSLLNKINPTYDFFKSKINALNILPQAIGLKKIKAMQSQDYIRINPELKKRDFSLPEYKNLEISGPLEKRLLISKPDLPEIPVWFAEKIAGSLQIKVWVDASGDIIFCQRVISSGSHALDIIGLDYVRNFKFAPYRKLQQGEIKLLFNADSSQAIQEVM